MQVIVAVHLHRQQFLSKVTLPVCLTSSPGLSRRPVFMLPPCSHPALSEIVAAVYKCGLGAGVGARLVLPWPAPADSCCC